MSRPLISALAASLLILVGCATKPAPSQTAAPFKPPEALTMTGVPSVPASLPARVGQYTEFKGAGVLDWSPDGKHLLVTFPEQPDPVT